jgi:opacity protein-like surface antigen
MFYLRPSRLNEASKKVAFAAIATVLSFGYAIKAQADGIPGSLKDTLPPPPEEYVWDGLYVGVGVGGESFDHNGNITLSKKSKYWTSTKDVGFGDDDWKVFGTVQVGYDRTFHQRFLIGAFADFDFTPDNNETFSGFTKLGCFEGNLNLHDVWNVGGRLGFLVNPRVLVYAAGGYSHADIDGSVTADFSSKYKKPTLTIKADDMDGFFVGGGTEVKIRKNVSVKLEYRYTGLGSQSASEEWKDFCETFGLKGDLDAHMHSVRASLVLKFGEPERPVEPLK